MTLFRHALVLLLPASILAAGHLESHADAAPVFGSKSTKAKSAKSVSTKAAKSKTAKGQKLFAKSAKSSVHTNDQSTSAKIDQSTSAKIGPATTYDDLPEQCRGVIPGMLGEYRFSGHRLQGVPAADQSNLQSWDEGMNKREISGIESVVWVEGPYYVLAINSPAGLVRRFCTFDAKDNRSSVCAGMDARDETLTETLYVTETDEDCNAKTFSIIAAKAWTPDDTAIANMFLDEVQGVRTSFGYPKTPEETSFPRSTVASFEGQVNYKWDEEHREQAYLDSGAFNPPVNVITGIKIKPGVNANPEAAVIFLTVPRWFGGVPSTLNKITVDLTRAGPVENPVLEPFPSWDMQEVGNCDALQYVQSMEIDNDGNMWIIDNGRVNTFTPTPDNACPPRLLIIDTDTGEMVDDPYIFPEGVVGYDSTFLNDITIDGNQGVAYISDMVGPNPGGLIVYNRNSRTSSRFFDDSMSPEKPITWFFRGDILGVDQFANPINGVALTPSADRVYYTALQGVTLYSVSTSALVDNSTDWKSTIINHGERNGSTDGMTIDCKGNLFHSDLNEGSIYSWNIESTEEPTSAKFVAGNDEEMWWTDTYAWDDAGYMWVTADFLPTVFMNATFDRMNIFRIHTGTGTAQSECVDFSADAGH